MRDRRLLIGLGVLVALVALFLVFRPGDEDEDGAGTTAMTTVAAPPTVEPTPTDTAPPTTAPPERVSLVVTIRSGEPIDGIVRARAKKDDPILLVVRSDVADEVHVHGYDFSSTVGPGKPVRMQFRATLTGRFEIELENRGKPIAQLTVVP